MNGFYETCAHEHLCKQAEDIDAMIIVSQATQKSNLRRRLEVGPDLQRRGKGIL